MVEFCSNETELPNYSKGTRLSKEQRLCKLFLNKYYI